MLSYRQARVASGKAHLYTLKISPYPETFPGFKNITWYIHVYVTSMHMLGLAAQSSIYCKEIKSFLLCIYDIIMEQRTAFSVIINV